MTTRTKSILVLAATLVIGMVIGALLFGAVQRQRFQLALRLARPGRMMASVEEVIRPVDEQQRQAVREVLEGFEARMLRGRTEAAQRMRAEIDSLQTQLSPLLSKDQLTRLRQHLIRHRGVIGRPKPPGRAPPPRPR
ncbi:hypothetical protein ACFL6X_02380 [Candidatus Latescibacterota bacterium]